MTELRHRRLDAELRAAPYQGPWWWRPGLMRHLTIIILLKLAAIVLIKFLFFRRRHRCSLTGL
ncbi:MAG: hypothetical protein II007_05475 [Gammaproteobacteria bacterium]|nr:hypothetical protein [Gammaproteobacteria bacterium]